jgi:hypothetical protein
MLKKPASGVLTSLGDSTYRSVQPRASLLAEALLDSRFEHPHAIQAAAPYIRFQRRIAYIPCFSAVN